MASYRTPFAKAHGLGAAKHGVTHWIAERVSAVALVPLTIWAVWAGLTLGRAGYIDAVAFVRQPINAVLLMLLALVSFQHMHAGMRVVVEDYIAKPMSRAVLLLLNLFVCVLAGALALFSLLKVALA